MDERDTTFLERAYTLAEKGRGLTSPNPVVGAVIVRDGAVLGEGWHVGPGRDHAEVAAIKDAVSRAGGDAGAVPAIREASEMCSGATMYVTLEPCCTQGRTPPCTDALITAGFARVVVGAIDPSPGVNGKGMEILRRAGMEVPMAEGALASRMKRQNDGLRKAVTQGLPFVTYKYAMTLDGRTATEDGDSRWISSPESRELVHRWRSWSDAVVIGVGTLRADDPLLTSRGVDCVRQPLRVVVDTQLSLEQGTRLVETREEGPVLVVCGDMVPMAKVREVEAWGVEVVPVCLDGDGETDPEDTCRALASRGVQTVLLEGGPRLAASWWQAGVIDRVAAFVCSKIVGGEDARGALVGAGVPTMESATELIGVDVARVGADVLVTGYTRESF